MLKDGAAAALSSPKIAISVIFSIITDVVCNIQGFATFGYPLPLRNEFGVDADDHIREARNGVFGKRGLHHPPLIFPELSVARDQAIPE
jgi:hypothetical protein